MDYVRTTIRMPKELHEQVKEKVKREDLTFSYIVRKLLREWVADPRGEWEREDAKE